MPPIVQNPLLEFALFSSELQEEVSYLNISEEDLAAEAAPRASDAESPSAADPEPEIVPPEVIFVQPSRSPPQIQKSTAWFFLLSCCL